MLFRNKSETVWGDIWNILFRIGEGCATNCYNCTSAFDEISYKRYSTYRSVFSLVKDICDSDLLVFFYGVEAIFHPEIEKYIEDTNLQWFQKSLHITPIYNQKRIQKILEISAKYPDISFDTCYTIKTKSDLILVLKFLRFLHEYNIKATIDLFFDYEKYLKIMISFLRQQDEGSILNKPVNTHLGNEKCIELSFHNSRQIHLLYHTKPQYIADSRIHNLPFQLCAVKKSFEITNDCIFTSEEIEFTENGDITVHFSTYCSKWIQKISSIYKTSSEIISDFQKFDSYLQQYESGDMWVNCFKCISNPYNNET